MKWARGYTPARSHLFLFFIFLLATGCEHIIPDEPPPPSPPPPFDGSLYLPLTPGNFWVLEEWSTGKQLRYTVGERITLEGRTYTWRYIEEFNPYGELIESESELLYFNVDTLFRATFKGTAPDSLTITGRQPILILNPYGIHQILYVPLDSIGLSWWTIMDSELSITVSDSGWREVIEEMLQYVPTSGYVQIVRVEYYEKRFGPIRIHRRPYHYFPGDTPGVYETYDIIDWHVE